MGDQVQLERGDGDIAFGQGADLGVSLCHKRTPK